MNVSMPDGCTLHVEDNGSGPPLLLVAGFGGLASFWAGTAALLRDRHRVITFDHRGRGRSDRPRAGHSIARLAEDAVAILDCLGIGKASIIGHSTGGIVAQALALDAPERVAHLVLSGSWARPDQRFRLLFETRLEVLSVAGPGAHARLSHLLGYPPDWLNTHAEEVAEKVEAAAKLSGDDQAVDAARLQMLLDHDRSREVPAIRAPTLVVSAEDDGIIPVNHGHELASMIPGAKLVLTQGGHFFPMLRPAAFAASVSTHLRETGASHDYFGPSYSERITRGSKHHAVGE